MIVEDIAKVTSKGQVTIPVRLRKFLHIRNNSLVSFKPIKEGMVVIFPVQEKPRYTEKDWKKIEELASNKGKIYYSALAAKKHIDSL